MDTYRPGQRVETIYEESGVIVAVELSGMLHILCDDDALIHFRFPSDIAPVATATPYLCRHCLALMLPSTTPGGESCFECANARCGKVVAADCAAEACIAAAPWHDWNNVQARGLAILDGAAYSELPHPLIWADDPADCGPVPLTPAQEAELDRWFGDDLPTMDLAA